MEAASSGLILREARSSPLDLELGGDLAGVPAGSTRFLTREDLQSLPQVTFTATDDSNFTAPTQVSGVALEFLSQRLSAHPESDLVVVLCDDHYRAHYPRSYIAAHHPLLALLINGKPPKDWPKDPTGHGMGMGPYLISHPPFTSRFSVLGQLEEPQIPWGVIRLEFRNEEAVFGAIAPRGPHAKDPDVQDGYSLAKQNCFRCHNMGEEGGHKAGRPWQVLASWALTSPDYFAAYVHDPNATNPYSHMPGNPKYDASTMQALIAYFRTFMVEQQP